MSREVDERILSMRFDKDQFEKGVRGTIKLLDEFEKTLKFKGAEEGLKNVSKAADKVDLSKLADSASEVEVRFSLMSIAVTTAISNIVTSAMNAGTQLVKALSIDQINAGFDKYAQKTASVQTIMNATGKSVEDVTAALAKLQWFSDETSYSFVDMTSNVGKFTSAGIELNTAISAMQGIANAAADAGATTVEASRAMYNFSQALSRGYVQLIDWKSIENANMATLTFKQTIVDSAAALGTLIETENGYITASGNSEVSATNFNEALKDGWFTTEVLLDALGKYSAYSDRIYDVADAFDTCADAMAATSEEGAELGARAFKAAQQAKTFTEAIDATKDAVSSGWMESFEIIFGNFNESVELWTGFTNTLWDVFASGAEARNAILRSGLSTGWNQLLDEYISDADSLKNVIIETARAQGVAIDDLISSSGSFEKSLKEGWLTSDMFMKSLDNIINDFETLSDEELRSKGYTEETIKSIANLKNALDEEAISIEEIADSLAKQSGRENIIEGIKNAYDALLSVIVPVKEAIAEVFPPMTGERLYELTEKLKEFTSQLGLSDEAAEGLKLVVQDILKPIKSLWEIVKAGGRLIGDLTRKVFSIVDALLALRTGGGPIPELMQKIFGEERYARLTSAISNLISNISEAISKVKDGFLNLKDSIKESEGMQSLLSGLYSVLSSIGSIVLDGIIGFFEFLTSINMSGMLDGVASFLGFILKLIGDLLSSIFDFSGGIGGFIKSIFDFIGSIFKLGETESIFSGLTSGLSSFLGTILGFVQGIGPAGIAMAIFGGIIVSFVVKILSTIHSISKVLTSVSEVFYSFSSGLKSISRSVTAGAILQIAIALGILVMSINSLSQIDTKTLLISLGAVVGLMLALVGSFEILAYTVGKNRKMSNDMLKISASMVSFAVAIGILSISLSSLAGLSLADIGKGLLSIIVLIGSMIVFMLAVQKLKTRNLVKLSSYFMSFGAAVLMMSVALKAISGIEYPKILIGLASIVTIIGVMALISSLMKKVKPSSGIGVLASALSILVVLAVLKKIAKEDPATIITGLLGFIPIFSAFVLMLAASNLAGKNAMRSAKFILSISASMLLISFAIKSMSAINTGEMITAMLVLSSLSALLALLLFVINKIKIGISGRKALREIGVMALELSAAAVILSIAIKSLGNLETAPLIKGTLAISVIMGMFSLIILASKNAKKAKTSAISISLAIGVLAVSVAILGKIDTEHLIPAVASIGILLGSVSLALKLLNGIKVGKALGQSIAIGLILSALSGALFVLQAINVDGLVEKAAAVAILAGALSTIILLITKFKSLENAGSSIKNIKNSISTTISVLIPTIAILAVAIGSLYLIKDVDTSIEKVGSLVGLIVALGAFSAIILAFSGKERPTDFKAIGIFVTSMIGVGVSASLALLMVKNVDGAVEKAAAISLVIIALGGMAALLGNIKVNPASVFSGLIEIIEILGVFGLLMGVLGAVFKDQSAVDAINRGTEIITSITTGIGEAIGGLISGFGAGLVSKLPEIGKSIGDFGANVKPFFSAFDGADTGSAIEGVTAIVKCVLGLTKNDFLQGINSFLGIGKTSFSQFGEDLKEFGFAFVEFSGVISAIPESAVDKMNAISDLATAISDATPSIGGIKQFFSGTKDIDAFGESLSGFGRSFVSFYDSIKDLDVDSGKIESVTNAAKMLSALNDNLPATGGLLQTLIGEKSFSSWGNELKSFGISFMGFYNIIKNVDVDSGRVETVANAGKMLSALNDNLPATGGLLQTLIGEKSFSSWGNELTVFGTAFVEFYNTISGIAVDEGLVSTVANAAGCLAALNDNLPRDRGVLQEWFGGGSASLGEFGTELTNFGNGFRSFYLTISGFSKVGDLTSAVDGMMVLISGVNTGIDALNGSNYFGVSSKFLNLGEALKAFGDGLKFFYQSISGFDSVDVDPITNLQNSGESLIDALITGINNKIVDLTSAGTDVVNGFLEGVNSADMSEAYAFAGELIYQVKTVLGTSAGNSTVLYMHGERVAKGFAKGIEDGTDDVIDAISELTSAIMQELNAGLGINSPSEKFMQAAKYCIDGFVIGLSKNSEDAYSGAVVMANGVITAIKSAFDIKSPSRVMRDEVGRYVVEGLADGISSNMSAIEAAQKMAQNIIAAFKSEFDKFSLDQTTFDLEYKLWEAYNPNASEEAVAKKKLEMLSQKMSAQAERVNLAEAQYQATLKALGENSEETQSAYNTYLQEQIDMAAFANEMLELQKNFSKKYAGSYAETLRSIEEYKDDLLSMGFSEEDIAAYLADQAAKSSGTIFTGNTTRAIIDKYMGNTQNVIDGYGKEIEVVLDTTLEKALSGASSGASNSAYNAGYNNGSSYNDGVNDALDIESSLGQYWESLKSEFGGLDWLKRESSNNGENLGNNFGQGIINGIKGVGQKMYDVTADLVGYGDKGFSDEAEEQSPSRLMYRRGVYFVQGLLNAIADKAPEMEDAMADTVGVMEKAIINMDSSSMSDTLDDIIANGIGSISGVNSTWQRFGRSLISGIRDGIMSGDSSENLNEAASLIALTVIGAAMDDLQMDRPESRSEKFYRIGQMIAQSMSDGMTDGMKLMSSTVGASIGSLGQLFGAATFTSSTPIFASPTAYQTVSPVIDSNWKKQIEEEIEDVYATILKIDDLGKLVPYAVAKSSEQGYAAISKDLLDMSHDNNVLLEQLYEISKTGETEAARTDETTNTEYNYTFNQYNTSPKALSESEVYRDTKNLLSQIKVREAKQ